MVQIFERSEMEEKEEFIVLIPEREAKVEKIETEPKKKKRRFRLTGFKNHAKYHEGTMCVNDVKARLDAKMYRNRINMI